MDQYQQYIHLSRYARWSDEEGRRETWGETVARYIDFWQWRGLITPDESDKLGRAIYDLEVMPSMRCLMTAGPALDRDNVAGYNCSYVTIDNPRAFDEVMYILLCGTGVGFSVERQYVQKLPEVAESFHDTDSCIRVSDSKIGWASAFRELVSLLYAGKVPKWDVSLVRPAGSRLVTFGGRASGPEPLVDLFGYTCSLFRRAHGRRLTSLECHDLVCKIADIVVVGGVRRSALISLSNFSDDRIRCAKTGNWWIDTPHRALANNSAVYTDKPDLLSFMKEWTSLYESKSGERGIFSRRAAQATAARNGRRDADEDFGTNPCSEIILRPQQFCNLSEVVVRSGDDLETLKRKVRLATVLGTLQSTLTNFRYLRKVWADNTKEERLLGVSLTGIMDHPHLSGVRNPDLLPQTLQVLREEAIETNKVWSDRLGIPQSTAITCVKPSGTVSQLVNAASGIHPRFANQYIRRVRGDKMDPLSTFMKDAGVPCEQDLMNPAALVFSFPVEAPPNAITVPDVSAMEQLKLWKTYADHWCEHKPSVTIYYDDSEFLEIGEWVWKHLDSISGISFLPRSDHVYQQAPYEAVDPGVFAEMSNNMPVLNWQALANYEHTDQTTGSQELACKGGACEL